MDEIAEKLLVGLYAETNSKRPQLGQVHLTLGISEEVFGRTVNSLYTKGLVSGVNVKFGDDDAKPILVTAQDMLMTRRGARYVEQLLKIDPTATKVEKLAQIIKKTAEFGWSDLKAMASKALDETLKGG